MRSRAGEVADVRRGSFAFAASELVPLARLAGLTAAVIAISVAVVSWTGGCEGASKHAEYVGYLNGVRALARSSDAVGAALSSTLLTPGLKTSELDQRLRGYAAQEQLLYDQGAQMQVPGPLLDAHLRLLAALQLRAQGFAGLTATLQQALPFRHPTSSSTLASSLAGQGQLLTTSDVVWDQLFRPAASEQITAQRLAGLAVPDSRFVANPDLLGARSFELLVQRLRGVVIGATPTPLLKAGDSGNAVAAWQMQLNRWLRTSSPAQPPLAITRVFDQPTESATKSLQIASSLVPDGVVGPATRKALSLAHGSAG